MLRRVVTENSLYSEAEEEEISNYFYVTDEDELTVYYIEEAYDKTVEDDFEDIPLCPLATMDLSIYSEIRVTGTDNMQPVAMDPVHPNDKSIQTDLQVMEQTVQEVQQEILPLVNNAERVRPADLPENIIIRVPEELSTPSNAPHLGSKRRRILTTDRLLICAIVCVFTALGMSLIAGIGLFANS